MSTSTEPSSTTVQVKRTSRDELRQLRRDIITMNEIANEEASRHELCSMWECIIDRINSETGSRLGLVGRSDLDDE